jgi:hypothetical protein
MKSFFSHFNFARALILLCLIGSIPLGWYGWQQYQLNTELKQDLAKGGRIERLIQDVQRNAHTFSTKQEEASAEGMAGESDPVSYIRTVARMDQIDLGQVDINPSDQARQNGIVDKIYRIGPKNKQRTFRRTALANFLFKLEQKSQRVRVTEIKMETEESRKVKPEDIPNDMWTFEAKITSRQRGG